MIYPAYQYVDIAIGGVNKRNNVKIVSEVKFPQGQVDCYRTWYRFPVEYLEHFQSLKTVKGYEGKCYCDFIPIDIDNDDLTISWELTKQFIELLHIDFDFDVRHLFFSGSKGFHIYLPIITFGKIIPSGDLSRIVKDSILDIAGDFELDHAIYDKNRLFRVANTINSKSGLYKIPLSSEQFNKGMDFILSLAKNPQKNPHPHLSDYVVNSQFVELYQKHKAEQSKITSIVTTGVSKGSRNVSCASLAGLLKSKGIDKELTCQLVEGWNSRNNPPLTADEVGKTIESIFRYPNNGDIDNFEENVKTIWSLSDEYHDYVISTKKVNLGISVVDKKIRGLRPG